MKRLSPLALILATVLSLAGCAHTPTWSAASARQREAGDFIYDNAYLDSQQFTNDVAEDVDTVMRLRKQLGKSTQ